MSIVHPPKRISMNTVSHKTKNSQQQNQTTSNNSFRQLSCRNGKIGNTYPVLSREDAPAIQNYFEESGRIKRSIINMALYGASRFKRFFWSHDTIAHKLGCSPDYVQEVLRDAQKQGIIIYRRRYNASNIYALPDWCRCDSIRETLASYLPGLRCFLSLSLLLISSGLRSSFDASRTGILQKPGIYIRDNEITLLDFNNKDHLGCTHVSQIVKNDVKAKDLYEHLGSSGRYLAIHMGLTPASSSYLAMVPSETMDEVLKAYCKAQQKQTPKDKSRFIGSILKNKLQEYNQTIDYSFVTSIINRYHFDSTWVKLTTQEQVYLMGQVSHIGRDIETTLQRTLCEERAKVDRTSEEAMAKQKEYERIQKLRSNPYSVYYTGYKNPRSAAPLTATKKEINIRPETVSLQNIQVGNNKEMFEEDCIKFATQLKSNMFLTYEMISNILIMKYDFLDKTFSFKDWIESDSHTKREST